MRTRITLRIGHPPRGPRQTRRGWPENASEIALYTMLALYFIATHVAGGAA